MLDIAHYKDVCAGQPRANKTNTQQNREGKNMSIDKFPIGQEFCVSYPEFRVNLKLVSTSQLIFEIKEGPFAKFETVEIQVTPLCNGIFAVSWQEADGATVTNIQDFDRKLVHSFATLRDGSFFRMSGQMVITHATNQVLDDLPERNKALVLDAMTSLFQRHDVSAVERLYSPEYVQHNPSIQQGREALHALVSSLPRHVYYEPGLMIAEGNFVAIHGRIRGWTEAPQVVVDIFRVEDGKLAEHWDVLQDEVSASEAIGGISMFDPNESSHYMKHTKL